MSISIEARAHTLLCDVTRNMVSAYDALVKIATEQDRIARAEERERCIAAAGAIVCKVHMCGTRVKCTPETCDKASNCGWLLELRKAMEGEV